MNFDVAVCPTVWYMVFMFCAMLRHGKVRTANVFLVGEDSWQWGQKVSIGALRMKGGTIQPAVSFYRLVQPETELKRKSVTVHEITPTELLDAESLDEVLEEFIEFIGDAVLVGHFVHIDINFVDRALKDRYGVSLQNRAVDTASILEWLSDNDSRFVRHYRGVTTKKDLFSIAKKYGVPAEKAHNAFFDAYVTAQLFQIFLFFLCESGVKRLKDLLIVGKT